MGLILDSSVLITAERQGQNARQMLAAIARAAGNTDVAISVVTMIELAHGAARAETAQRKAMRQQFIQEPLTALPIHPVTVTIALRVGHIDGENQRGEAGRLVPLCRLDICSWTSAKSGDSCAAITLSFLLAASRVWLTPRASFGGTTRSLQKTPSCRSRQCRCAAN